MSFDGPDAENPEYGPSIRICTCMYMFEDIVTKTSVFQKPRPCIYMYMYAVTKPRVHTQMYTVTKPHVHGKYNTSNFIE